MYSSIMTITRSRNGISAGCSKIALRAGRRSAVFNRGNLRQRCLARIDLSKHAVNNVRRAYGACKTAAGFVVTLGRRNAGSKSGRGAVSLAGVLRAPSLPSRCSSCAPWSTALLLAPWSTAARRTKSTTKFFRISHMRAIWLWAATEMVTPRTAS